MSKIHITFWRVSTPTHSHLHTHFSRILSVALCRPTVLSAVPAAIVSKRLPLRLLVFIVKFVFIKNYHWKSRKNLHPICQISLLAPSQRSILSKFIENFGAKSRSKFSLRLFKHSLLLLQRSVAVLSMVVNGSVPRMTNTRKVAWYSTEHVVGVLKISFVRVNFKSGVRPLKQNSPLWVTYSTCHRRVLNSCVLIEKSNFLNLICFSESCFENKPLFLTECIAVRPT